MTVNFGHPANAGILRHLKRNWDGSRPEHLSRPPDVRDLYGLGTHPDLVDRLWKGITSKLPEDCAWVVCARPTLVHSVSGIIFGFAIGTHAYALRLPESMRKQAEIISPKRVFQYPDGDVDLDEIGVEWIFGGWLKGEEDWCLAAWEWAGKLGL